MKTNNLLLLFLLLSFNVIGQTYNVTNGNDSGAGSLRAAIASANAGTGGTITFADNFPVILTSGVINISQSVTINGNGVGNTSISGNGSSAIFISVVPVTITINDITFQDGKSTTNGGAINANAIGGSLIVNNCSFTNNTATNNGGAIYSRSSLTLNNCTITGSKAGYDAATSTFLGAYNGGALYAFDALTLQGSITLNNNITNGSGGAIWKNNVGNCTTSGLTNITVDNNTAITGAGGGLYLHAPMSLKTATITNNTSGNKGGGIMTDTISAGLTLTDAIISGNKAGFDYVNNVFFPSPRDTINGGGIYSYSPLILAGSIRFENNKTTREGGALWKHSNGSFTTTDLTSLIVNNNSTIVGEGGGIYTLVTLNLSGVGTVTFTNNNAGSNGGGLRTGGGAVLTLTGGTFSNNIAGGSGGGIFANGIATVSNAMVTGNAAKVSGGGIYGNSTLTLNNTTISNNKAGYNTTTGLFGTTGSGGGVNAMGTLTLTGNIVVQDNIAPARGGGINKTGGASTFNTGGLTSLTVSRNNAGGTTNVGKGGGIYTESALTLTNSNGVSITDNFVQGSGGGIYASVDSGLIRVYLNNIALITNNAATVSGGGIYSSGSLALQDMAVSGNKAGYNPQTSVYTNRGGGGGGVYAADTLSLAGTIEFSNNIMAGNGGAIYKAASKPFLTTGLNSFVVSQNTAQLNIGSAASGGGIYTLAPLSLNGKNGVITINSNSTDVNGGGIYANDSLTLNSLTLSSNNSFGSGGAVYLSSTGKMLSVANTFDGNNCPAADGNGGAIAMDNMANATIINNTFSNNYSMKGDGGAIYMRGSAGSALKVAFSTFNGNFAMNGNGQAIFMGTSGTKELNGNIIYGNGTGGAEIVFGGTLNSAYNVIRGTSVLPTATGNVNVPAGQVSQIFSSISSGDLATLGNNGGPTQTINIVKNGLVYNFIPMNIFISWTPAVSQDQRGMARAYSCKVDAGAVELSVPDDPAEFSVNVLTVCPNSVVQMSSLVDVVSNVKSVSYYYDDQYTIPVTVSSITVSSPITIYSIITSVGNCDVYGYSPINIFPTESTWTGSGNDSDWNDGNNWDNGVPGPCTSVIIPENLSSYPVLQPGSSSYPDPSCDTITFKFGGEVAKTNLLHYASAKVELTLNDPNRWWMVSAPLINMYSGDYFVPNYEGVGTGNRTTANGNFRYNPAIYIMQYQVNNPQDIGIQAAAASTWSQPFNTVDVVLRPGDGYVIWPDKTPGAGDSPQTTFRFPKDSTIYSYYDGQGQWTESSSGMDRINNGRFIYELQNQIGNGFFVTPKNLNTSGYETMIVGNPFMSHLDMNAFLAANTDVLQPSYYIWSGGDFEPQLVIPGVNQYVAPMQSFIVTKKFPNSTSNTPLILNYSMSVTQPGSFILKSSSATNATIDNSLNISLFRGDDKQSGMTMMYRDINNAYNPAKDVYTLFNNDSYNTTPVLYGLLDGKAVSIHTGNDSPFELGIRSKSKESLTLDFAGMETFNPEASLYLEDRLLGKSINLRSQQSYTFEVDSATISGRFYLRVSNAYTAIDEVSPVADAGNIRIVATDKLITATSAATDPIRRVELYDTRGVRLFSEVYNEPEVTIANRYTGIVIVKVVTTSNNKTQKLLVDGK